MLKKSVSFFLRRKPPEGGFSGSLGGGSLAALGTSDCWSLWWSRRSVLAVLSRAPLLGPVATRVADRNAAR